MQLPDLTTFLDSPRADVAALAPQTAIVSVNGTRRSAALAGVTPHTDAYAEWSRQGMLAYMDLLFGHGIRNVFAAAVIAPNMIEFAHYRERFLGWIAHGLAGQHALADYARRGWRVRISGADAIPELQNAAETLVAATPDRWEHTLWWTVTPSDDAPWDAVLSAGARTRAEAIRALYGEDIPLATMFISFGKPIVIYDLIPPLLVDRLQCYWIMRPGYRLDEPMLRHILYDYAYTRKTGSGPSWSERYANLGIQRGAWSTQAVLGVGQRMGPFWYPVPFPQAEDLR